MTKHPSLETTAFIVLKKQMELDLYMVPFDIWGTKAHVLMLYKQQIIDQEKTKKILIALEDIEKQEKKHLFIIDPSKGAQLTLEAEIVKRAGDAGYSVHTGRSRNDQVIVTELLFGREKVLDILCLVQLVMKELHTLSKKYEQTITPGYTHMQPAKPTSVGQWSLSFLFSFHRATETLKHMYEKYSMNPLGACESYGTSWPINREYTTKLLAFDAVWEIPLDAISSRGFAQYGYLSGLSEICIIASKIAQDLLLFTMFEFGYAMLSDTISQRMHPITGSSVMAQKKNPDVLELIRSTAPQVIGFTGIVANIMDSMYMGYNRDIREVKEYVIQGVTKTSAVLSSLQLILKTLSFNSQKMKIAVYDNYSLTTDLADYISQKTHIGYRIIYKIVGQVVDEAIQQNKKLTEITALEIIQEAQSLGINLFITNEELQQAIDPANALFKRQHTGGSNHKIMVESEKRALGKITKLDNWIRKKKKKIENAKKYTKTSIKKITT